MANPKAFTAKQIQAFELGAAYYEQRFLLHFDSKTMKLEDVFAPGFFKLVSGKLNKNDIIRVLSPDTTIDFDVCVVSKKNDDVVVKLRPRVSRAVLDAASEAEREAVALPAIAAA
jgi:hypothetical protein